ncbi:MAG: S-layer homology domain-containing protein [Bacillota bacterium]
MLYLCRRVLIFVLTLVSGALLVGTNAKIIQAANPSLYDIISQNAAGYLAELESSVSPGEVKAFVDAIDDALSGQAFSDEETLINTAAAIILSLASSNNQSYRNVFNAVITKFGQDIEKVRKKDYSGFEPLYNAIKQKYLGAGTTPGGSGGAPPAQKPEQQTAPLAPEKVIEQLTTGKLTPEEAAATLLAGLDSLSPGQLSADNQKNLSAALEKIFAVAGKIDPGQLKITGDGQAAVLSVPESALKSQLARINSLRATITEGLDKAGRAALTKELPAQVVLATPSEANRPQIIIRLPAPETKEISAAGINLSLQAPSVRITIPPGSVPAYAGQAGALEFKIEALGNAAAEKLMANVPTGEVNRLAPVGKPLAIDFSLPGVQADKANFSAPIKISFGYSKGEVLDPELLGVYVFNEDKNSWDYLGGDVDPGQNLITIKRTHLSIYNIMEYCGDFRDLAGHWARRDVRIMAAKRLVSGTGADTFAPDRQITRAEFAVILARMIGLPANSGAAGRFIDIPSDAWYRGMVGAAAKAGLVAGTSPDTFGPDEPITREQMAVMIARLLARQKAVALKEDATAEKEAGNALASLFRDAASVSPWARQSVALVAREKIMQGRTATQFAPDGKSTRAEATAVLYRTLKKIWFSGSDS